MAHPKHLRRALRQEAVEAKRPEIAKLFLEPPPRKEPPPKVKPSIEAMKDEWVTERYDQAKRDINYFHRKRALIRISGLELADWVDSLVSRLQYNDFDCHIEQLPFNSAYLVVEKRHAN